MKQIGRAYFSPERNIDINQYKYANLNLSCYLQIHKNCSFINKNPVLFTRKGFFSFYLRHFQNVFLDIAVYFDIVLKVATLAWL